MLKKNAFEEIRERKKGRDEDTKMGNKETHKESE